MILCASKACDYCIGLFKTTSYMFKHCFLKGRSSRNGLFLIIILMIRIALASLQGLRFIDSYNSLIIQDCLYSLNNISFLDYRN